MDEAVDRGVALSRIADPAVREVVRALQDELHAAAAVVTDYQALLQEYQAVVAGACREQRVT